MAVTKPLPQRRPGRCTVTAPCTASVMLHPCRQLLLCQMRGGVSSAARALARSAPIQHPLWSTGQRVFRYYQRRLPPVDPSFSDSTKLKVKLLGRHPAVVELCQSCRSQAHSFTPQHPATVTRLAPMHSACANVRTCTAVHRY